MKKQIKFLKHTNDAQVPHISFDDAFVSSPQLFNFYFILLYSFNFNLRQSSYETFLVMLISGLK